METTPWVLQPVHALLELLLVRFADENVHHCQLNYSHAYTGQWGGRKARILVYNCSCGEVREEVDYYYN